MTSFRAAVIGAGSQGRVHARSYAGHRNVRLVAIADLDRAAARELATDLDVTAVYESYDEMLTTEHPDLVSICTPPASHLDAVKKAVAAGVKAIHCEKPVALSYADALAMDMVTREAGVQLTFNLQRRFEPVHRFAFEQLHAGVIGETVSVEGYCPNLPDWGAHIFDLVLFYLDDAAPAWVLGQIDVSINRFVYDAVVETSSVTLVKWDSGVNATVHTGRDPQTPILNLENNLGVIIQGTAGRIDVRGARCTIYRFDDKTIVFDSPFSTDSSTWERRVDPAIVACTAEAIRDLVASLEGDREPILSSRHGIVGAELIFATYESSRSRGRVQLPLQKQDNALLAGLEAGFWSPVGEQRSTY